ncbi:MAG: hypothetical protein IJS27_00265, partial [Ruminococcus sp.]|nr:hypothetical protein [Ruminococcus sp.]
MRKCKQVISLILALTLMFTMLSVGIVQTSAADDDDEIYANPPSEPALLGDVNRDGEVNLLDVYVLRSSIAKRTGYLRYADYSENTIEFKVADVFKDYEEDLPEAIDLKDVYLLRSWLAHRDEAQDKGIGEPVYVDPTEPPVEPTDAPVVPTQAPTEAPTEYEPTTATVTIYGLNGQSETREFHIGDTFSVYTSLNVKKSGNDVQIASAAGSQTYSDSILTLTSETDDEGLFTDTAAVFPVFGDKGMGRNSTPGMIGYNASTPSTTDAFVFDSDDDLVIVTTYTVAKGGTGEVRNALSMLAAADNELTKLVKNGSAAPGVALTVNATFEKPLPPATEPPATVAPTNPPATVAPTNPPATVAPTNPPATVAPTNPPATVAPTNPPATVAPTNPPATVAPTNPPATVAPTNPPATVAPTNPPATVAPTNPPTEPAPKATVTIYGLDGESETREFNVGETFTVYTTLNTSAYENGGIGSLNGTQTYSNAVLTLTDEYDPDEGDIMDPETMFPILKSSVVANGKETVTEEDPTLGAIYFNASKASIK